MKYVENDELQFTWDNHHSSMAEFFKNLYETKYCPDITLSVGGDGAILRAHRLVLAMSSQRFHDDFKFAPSNEPFVILSEIKLEEMQWILEYMYLGSIKIKQMNLDRLMRAANILKINSLLVQREPTEDTAGRDDEIIIPPVDESESPPNPMENYQQALKQAMEEQSVFMKTQMPAPNRAPVNPPCNPVSLSGSLNYQQLFPTILPSWPYPMMPSMPSTSFAAPSYKYEDTPEGLQLLQLLNTSITPISTVPLAMDLSSQSVSNNFNMNQKHISHNFSGPSSSHRNEYSSSGESNSGSL